VYDKIGDHFSSTRYKAWPRVRQFVESLPVGSVVADIGCGNGKNMNLGGVTTIGVDYCEKLIRVAQRQNFSVVRGDAIAIPLRSGMFDAAISIAVIHHFATPERRAAALGELLRLLVPGGCALVYVWAKEQPKD
jgi:ubiquinone/menaquinone biosynthesis C-methylase UbiE